MLLLNMASMGSGVPYDGNFLFAVVLDIYLAQMMNFGDFSIVQLLDLVGFIILVFVLILLERY